MSACFMYIFIPNEWNEIEVDSTRFYKFIQFLSTVSSAFIWLSDISLWDCNNTLSAFVTLITQFHWDIYECVSCLHWNFVNQQQNSASICIGLNSNYMAWI